MPRDSWSGAYNELVATVWLLKQGYDVFRNISAHGPIDLIAVNRISGETILFDVKACDYSLAGEPRFSKLSEPQVHLGVKCLGVFPEGLCRINQEIQKIIMSDCKQCQKQFEQKRQRQVYCSQNCAAEYHYGPRKAKKKRR